MRILHTSDWHIGRTFHGQDLLADQRSVLGSVADIVAQERVDVVVIAGDLYDRAVPSSEAVGVCNAALTGIAESGARIVVIPGNHDSAPRMGAFAGFAAAGGLHLRTRIASLHEPVLLPDRHGTVALYGIPYLEPDPARHLLGLADGVDAREQGRRRQDQPQPGGHAAVLSEAMARIRADLAARDGTRSVVLAHAFVTGGEGSESERTIAVGGVEEVPASVFDGVNYVALGHLHGPQVITDTVRYSGSPLAYSFSEAAHSKSVWLVDMDAHGLTEVRRRELPVPRALATVTDTLRDMLTEPAHEALVDRYLSITLTDEVRPVDAMRRLRERFPYAVHMEWRPEGGERERSRYADAVRGRDDREVATDFVAECRGSAPDRRERELLASALRSVTTAEVG